MIGPQLLAFPFFFLKTSVCFLCVYFMSHCKNISVESVCMCVEIPVVTWIEASSTCIEASLWFLSFFLSLSLSLNPYKHTSQVKQEEEINYKAQG